MILSPSQEIAKTKISDFLKSYDVSRNMFILEGSAGTGKSTVITHILNLPEYENKKVVYSATTNKAVSVLKKYSSEPEKYSYCTIHKLLNIKRKIDNTGRELFEVILDEETRETIKAKSIYQYDIIVIDESSMISCSLLTKLVKILEKIPGKIIFLGDPAQLPPVNENNSLIFHTKNIPRYRLKEIMRYKGQIVDLCNSVRDIVFDPSHKIKFNSYKCDTIKLYKDFEKCMSKYLKFIQKGFRPIFLVYTNRKCDLINSKIRENIFSGTKKKYEAGEIILFNNFHKSKEGNSYYTSQQMIVKNVKETEIDFSGIDINSIFTMSFKKKKKVKLEGGCVICYGNVERDSICGCRLCNGCIREWINNKLVCPYCFIKIYGNRIEIKGDSKLEEMINNLVIQFEGLGFKTYDLTLNVDDIIVTIHEDSEKSYKEFIENIKDRLKDIKLYIDKNYKKNKLFNALMLNLWENFYQKYIDILADICYGYAITTHKSQGSNYKVVFVDMENIITCNNNQVESYRCLYTAITRTSKYLNILM
jgi:hypothetical protein